MRVLYLIDSLVPGGAERSLAALAPSMVAQGVDLHVGYLQDAPGLEAELEAAGASLVSLAGRGGRAGWTARIAREIQELRPDVVHTTLFESDITGRAAGFLSRVPVVSSLVNVAYGASQFSDPRLRGWKLRAACAVDAGTARTVRRFHAVAEHVAAEMSTRLRIDQSKIDVVPRGRDPRELGEPSAARRRMARRELGIEDDRPLVLAAGRQEFQKGFDVLLDAAALLTRAIPDLTVVIAGRDGNASTSLKEQAIALELGSSVAFLGARDDLADLMCACDVFTLPSRWEGLPGVVLEAMALGAPIVATDIPPVREIFSGSDGALLVPEGSTLELADAIVDALAIPDAAARRGRVARAIFEERYTVDRVAGEMTAFYRRALDR